MTGGHMRGLPVAEIINPDDPRHGTPAGHWAHVQARVATCEPCRRAKNVYDKIRLLEELEGRTRKVPALGARRRIQSLQALGWTLDQIARAAGLSSKRSFQYVQTEAHETCTRKTFERVRSAYDRLSMTAPEASFGKSRAQTAARKNGWVPPLAWDDIDTDEAPVVADDDMSPKERRDAERLDRLEVMDSEHRTVTYAADALGLSREGLNAWCRDRGHMDLYWRLVNRDPETGENQHTAA